MYYVYGVYDITEYDIGLTRGSQTMGYDSYFHRGYLIGGKVLLLANF